MRLEHLVYTSEPTATFTQLELEALVAHAAAKNEKLSVTGLLLFGGGHFMQLLEGPPAALDALYAVIKADPRHRLVKQVDRQAVGGRLFSTWHMGLLTREVRPLDRDELTRALCCAANSAQVPARTHRSLALLRSFQSQFIDAPAAISA